MCLQCWGGAWHVVSAALALAVLCEPGAKVTEFKQRAPSMNPRSAGLNMQSLPGFSAQSRPLPAGHFPGRRPMATRWGRGGTSANAQALCPSSGREHTASPASLSAFLSSRPLCVCVGGGARQGTLMKFEAYYLLEWG